jgi:hypothetical protein
MKNSKIIVPEQVPSPQKKSNFWMFIAILLFVALCSIGAYMFGKGQGQTTNKTIVYAPQPTRSVTSTQIIVTPPISITLSPTSTPSIAMTGTVTGTLCYPSSLVPKGTITAKNITTSEIITQDYPGTPSGAGTTYTLSLKPGTYHMKYAPQDYATVIGYYTDYSSCVGNPENANCTGQKTRPLLPVVITAGNTTNNVNLCDYYYPPESPPVF